MSLNENKLYVGNNDTNNSIKNDLIIYENVKQVPITPYPSYIENGIVMLCSEGYATFKVYNYEHVLEKMNWLFFFPDSFYRSML